MSNLGFYQTATSVIKKVGGPKRFCGLALAAVGTISTASGVIGYKIGKGKGKGKAKKSQSDIAASKVFTVTSDSVDNQGLKFCVGEKFVVLESDKDAILIEKIGDSHNPYFVSAEFLHSISDFVN